MNELIACEYCDLLYTRRPIAADEKAHCTRCNGVLYKSPADSLRRTLMLSITALILLVIANVYPFMSFSMEGQTQENRIISSVALMWDQGDHAVAALVLFTSVVAPLLQILATLYLVTPLLLGRTPHGIVPLMRFQTAMGPWAMLDVYMLAVLASVVKLAQMAHIEPGLGAYSFFALILISAAASAALDPEAVWDRVGKQP
jgi:paraquat-inducible protein A